jgi:hypothetical protein
MTEKIALNVDVLTKVRDHLITHQARVDMGSWCSGTVRSLLQEECGTTGCLAGWTCALMNVEFHVGDDYGKKALQQLLVDPPTYLCFADREYYLEQSLFHAGNWPDEYNDSPADDGTLLVALLTDLIEDKRWLEWDEDNMRMAWCEA